MKTPAYFLIALLLVACGKFKQTEPTEATESLHQLWDEYYATIEEVRQEFISSDVFDIDDAHRAGAYDLLQSFIASNTARTMQADIYNPHIGIMLSPSIRLGIDNPDTFYRNTFVGNPTGDWVYRIWGNRGNTADWLLELFDSANPKGAISVFEDEDLITDGNGNYEVFLSAEKMGVNWMQLKPTNGQLNLIIRDSYSNWEAEKGSTVFIERLGSAGIPSANPHESQLLTPLKTALGVLKRQGRFWVDFAKKLQLLGHNNFSKFKATESLGIISQYYGVGYFSLEDDEALVFKLPEVNAGYCGTHISNFWASAPDWVNRQVSLSWCRNGQGQAYKAKDGMYYFVVSSRDAGIQNWMDTAGLTQGLVILRIQSPYEDINLKPQGQLIKLADLDQYIPQDMPRWDAKRRKQQIKMRQNHVRQRYQTY